MQSIIHKTWLFCFPFQLANTFENKSFCQTENFAASVVGVGVQSQANNSIIELNSFVFKNMKHPVDLLVCMWFYV